MTDKQQLQMQEEQIKQAWEQEGRKYKSMVVGMDDIQLAVLTAARNYYISLKNSLTHGGDYDIADVRGNGLYTAETFPHSLKTNEIALAWIIKTGENGDMTKRMFPNQAIPSLAELRDVRIEKFIYDLDRPGFIPVTKGGHEISNSIDFRLVLVVLRYLALCEKQKFDEIISIDSVKASRLRCGYIKVETKYYFVQIKFKGLTADPIEYISITPKKALKDR